MTNYGNNIIFIIYYYCICRSSKCSLLEECLGGAGVLASRSLPPCWLPPDILDAKEDLEARAHRLKGELMALLKDCEHKKKVVSSG